MRLIFSYSWVVIVFLSFLCRTVKCSWTTLCLPCMVFILENSEYIKITGRLLLFGSSSTTLHIFAEKFWCILLFEFLSRWFLLLLLLILFLPPHSFTFSLLLITQRKRRGFSSFLPLCFVTFFVNKIAFLGFI